jgi:hypothetical protein
VRCFSTLVALALCGGCAGDGECDPATATSAITARVTTPGGDPLDDATVELNGEGCDSTGDGTYDCGTAPEGTVEVFALHPMWGSVVQRTELDPCDVPALDVELALESPMGL